MNQVPVSVLRCKDHHDACDCRHWETEELKRKYELLKQEHESMQDFDNYKTQVKINEELTARLNAYELKFEEVTKVANVLKDRLGSKDRIQIILKHNTDQLVDLLNEKL